VAAVLLLAAAVGLALLQQQVTALEAALAARSAEVAALDQTIVDLQQQLAREQAQLALFSDADRVIAIGSTGVQPDVRGAFFQRGETAMLAVRGLAPLPAGQTYQLWLIPAEGTPASAGLLGREGETVRRAVAIPEDAGSFVAVGISIEPAEGSEAPTGPIVALGREA
jgi:anti-sigma-K factor RskA